MRTRKSEPWCDEIVRIFVEWVNARIGGDSGADVVMALRTAMAMLLTPDAFSNRDYVLFKLGEDKKVKEIEVGLDKVVDARWSWDFVCVRPQKIEILSDCHSEDGFGGSNWMHFPVTEIKPSGEWTTSGDAEEFSLPNRPIRGIKVVQRGGVVCHFGDIKISDVCLSSLTPTRQKRWSNLAKGV